MQQQGFFRRIGEPRTHRGYFAYAIAAAATTAAVTVTYSINTRTYARTYAITYTRARAHALGAVFPSFPA